MKLTYRFLQVLLMLLLLTGFGCSSSSKNNDNTDKNPVTKTGVFVDAPVVGLAYSSESHKGVTDENGKFKYVDGEEVKFFVGGVLLGISHGDDIVTPFDLEDENGAKLDETTAVNVIRFLLSIATETADGRLEINANAAEILADIVIDFKTVTDTDLEAAVHAVDGDLSLKTANEARDHYYNTLKELAEDNDLKFTNDMLEDKTFVYLIVETKEKGKITFKKDGTIEAAYGSDDEWSVEDGKLQITSDSDPEKIVTLISETDHIIALVTDDQGNTLFTIKFFNSNDLVFEESMVKGKTFSFHVETTDGNGENIEEPEIGFVTFNENHTASSEDEDGSYEDTWSITDDGMLCIEDGGGGKEYYNLFSQKGSTIVAFINDGNTTTLTLKKIDPDADRSKEVTLSSGDFFRFNPDSLGGSSIMYDDLEGNLFLPHSMALSVNESYESITQAPYGIYRDSNGNNPPVFPATPGKVYVFQAPDYSDDYVLPAYYKLEIISATIRPDIESPEIGEVKFKYTRIMEPDFVDVFGEWKFDEEAHLSIMSLDMIDYHPPHEPGEFPGMFFFGRMSVASKTTMQGTMEYFVDGELFEKTVKLTFTEKGSKLDVKVEGDPPLENTTLRNGVRQTYE